MSACGRCLRRPPAYDGALALWPYRFPVDQLVQELKYRHHLGLARFLGHALGAAALGRQAQDSGWRPTRILPMPLHPDRWRERGFNQALEIARPLARLLGVPMDDSLLIRRRATPAQAGQHLARRQRNLRGAFLCQTSPAGQEILLVDDVMTSGASAAECARTLKQGGASKVWVAVVARALAPGQRPLPDTLDTPDSPGLPGKGA